jgi:CheY-like chemotaxis protein
MVLGTEDNPLIVLLVEDNPGDVELAKRVISDSDFNCRLWVAEDGDVALSFLRQTGDYADSPRPDLILLDLNLPKTDGWEVFRQMHRHNNLWLIPTIILTSTTAEGMSLMFRQLHPSRYCQKPLPLERFNELAGAIVEVRTKVREAQSAD